MKKMILVLIASFILSGCASLCEMLGVPPEFCEDIPIPIEQQEEQENQKGPVDK